MGYKFNKEDIEKISVALNSNPDILDSNWTWRLDNIETGQSLVISLYNEINLGGDIIGSMVSIQTRHGYFELHDCQSYLIFEPDEIIFVGTNGDFVSCLIAGKQGTCSMYSNIRREILHSDFNNLDPAVLLSAMQLSLTESVLS